ncbi:TPA: replication initiation protein [Enterobacter hormaechei]|jgi:plasmid replication initiation protein|nr:MULTISPECIES: replication initiation protein [Enterobacterales]EHX6122307.1 replication initiation protein [Salmonella enterica subsp. enterica serovar Infantis]ELX2277054.1 replication initiation protein [Yersinia enterocolitica]BDD36597.1 replication initiation protein [uncultured bacterium]HDS8361351.1 replication initiation protein [Serratia liquefaciens]HEE9994485.1 replication initiation protein [Citrobacter braakii]
MSELIVFKANELAVSRYDLTDQETKLILYCVAHLNPCLEPTRENRTLRFNYAEYANTMGMTPEQAWNNLYNSTKHLMTRTVEITNPTVKKERIIFQWTNFAKFSSEELELVFSEEILPYLFQLKKFIKYNLEHVKLFKNKYSMRVYEWLLKELTQKNTHRANIEISIDDFKFMLMLETNYPEFKKFKQNVLNVISKDLNTYSNMKLEIEKRGRPADTLIFQAELNTQIDLVTELAKDPELKKADKKIILTPENRLHEGLKKTLHDALTVKIQLTSFEAKFLSDMQSKYDLNGSFSWLTQKQRTTLENILAKYGRI